MLGKNVYKTSFGHFSLFLTVNSTDRQELLYESDMLRSCPAYILAGHDSDSHDLDLKQMI